MLVVLYVVVVVLGWMIFRVRVDALDEPDSDFDSGDRDFED